MKIGAYTPDADVVMRHYMNMVNNKPQHGGGSPSINLITPTAAATQQAVSKLKDMGKRGSRRHRLVKRVKSRRQPVKRRKQTRRTHPARRKRPSVGRRLKKKKTILRRRKAIKRPARQKKRQSGSGVRRDNLS